VTACPEEAGQDEGLGVGNPMHRCVIKNYPDSEPVAMHRTTSIMLLAYRALESVEKPLLISVYMRKQVQ
jgi:hypothetical protein